MNYELMWAFRRSRRAFRYIFARSHRSQIPSPLPFPVPKSRPRSRSPSPNPIPEPRSQRMPLQSLTQTLPKPKFLLDNSIPNSYGSAIRYICHSPSGITNHQIYQTPTLTLTCCLVVSLTPTRFGRRYELRSSYLPIFCRP